MFISGTDADKRANGRSAVIYLAMCTFCGFFSSVYGKFSHGVSSDMMVFLCLFPFFLGVIPHFSLRCFGLKAPCGMSRSVYGCGVATLTVGACLDGIFEIYGSSCAYVPYYFYVGTALITIGVLIYLIKR